MAVLIAAPASGSGKTLLSLTLLSWASSIGKRVQPFKVGPDYLDPQHLSAAAGRPCRNLDLNLCGETWICNAFLGYSADADLALVEGVMGLFDGIGSTERGSTASIARLLELPVILIIDANGQAASIGALIQGFRNHDPRLNIAGVVLNRVSSERHKIILTDVLENLNIPLLGCFPRSEDMYLPSRHLGLAPVNELKNIKSLKAVWAELAKRYLNLNQFIKLLRTPQSGPDPLSDVPNNKGINLPVAIALDKAFHFRYQETLELLERMGMPIIPWSPISNNPIPPEAKGLIIPGGFPEIYLEELSNCKQSLDSLGTFISSKPVYAECGGMLLLGKNVSDSTGKMHQLAGILPFEAKGGKLEVGYRVLTPCIDGMLVRKGETILGHEFHRWMITDFRRCSNFSMIWKSKGWHASQKLEGWGNPNFHASWIHLHWASCSKICHRWRKTLELKQT